MNIKIVTKEMTSMADIMSILMNYESIWIRFLVLHGTMFARLH